MSKIKKILYPFSEKIINDYVNVHIDFEEDFSRIIDKSGNKEQYIKLYNKCLRFLTNLKENCILQPNNFEKLVGEEDLYCMRLKGKMNLRILFYFVEIKGNNKSILLVVFPEKTSKDYEKNIKIARNRINDINSIK